ncbi:uncharacterized protein LOC100242601 [Anopheles sinensis]|uniref:Uncharacterized protein LOC100242601 n=1 Tax=Anopheles sinensis TaxID=74873 RepID=A0A084WM51_ANOSI|nr:uncharacterized protein LOC100242601 [Anopheles sinensis]
MPDRPVSTTIGSSLGRLLGLVRRPNGDAGYYDGYESLPQTDANDADGGCYSGYSGYSAVGDADGGCYSGYSGGVSTATGFTRSTSNDGYIRRIFSPFLTGSGSPKLENETLVSRWELKAGHGGTQKCQKIKQNLTTGEKPFADASRFKVSMKKKQLVHECQLRATQKKSDTGDLTQKIDCIFFCFALCFAGTF